MNESIKQFQKHLVVFEQLRKVWGHAALADQKVLSMEYPSVREMLYAYGSSIADAWQREAAENDSLGIPIYPVMPSVDITREAVSYETGSGKTEIVVTAGGLDVKRTGKLGFRKEHLALLAAVHGSTSRHQLQFRMDENEEYQDIPWRDHEWPVAQYPGEEAKVNQAIEAAERMFDNEVTAGIAEIGRSWIDVDEVVDVGNKALAGESVDRAIDDLIDGYKDRLNYALEVEGAA